MIKTTWNDVQNLIDNVTNPEFPTLIEIENDISDKEDNNGESDYQIAA